MLWLSLSCNKNALLHEQNSENHLLHKILVSIYFRLWLIRWKSDRIPVRRNFPERCGAVLSYAHCKHRNTHTDFNIQTCICVKI